MSWYDFFLYCCSCFTQQVFDANPEAGGERDGFLLPVLGAAPGAADTTTTQAVPTTATAAASAARPGESSGTHQNTQSGTTHNPNPAGASTTDPLDEVLVSSHGESYTRRQIQQLGLVYGFGGDVQNSSIGFDDHPSFDEAVRLMADVV